MHLHTATIYLSVSKYSLGLTALDIGDIYLNTLYYRKSSRPDAAHALPSVPDDQFMHLSFTLFLNFFTRCALYAFKHKTRLSCEQKLKACMLHIWRHLVTVVQDHRYVWYQYLHILYILWCTHRSTCRYIANLHTVHTQQYYTIYCRYHTPCHLSPS